MYFQSYLYDLNPQYEFVRLWLCLTGGAALGGGQGGQEQEAEGRGGGGDGHERR